MAKEADITSAEKDTPPRDDGTYNHIMKYTGFFGGIQALTLLVSVIRNKLAAVLLGTMGVGLSALYQSITNFLHNASNLGIAFSSIKEISEHYGKGHKKAVARKVEVVRTWSLWTALAGILLCILFSPLISQLAFGDSSHIIPICILSPMVGFMTITAGELSILKAVRKLKRLALISILSAVGTLLFTVPFYYFWGMRGVVPALLFGTLAVMLVHLRLSLPVFPWHVALTSKAHLKAGWSLVKVGVPYILAAIVNMGVGLIIAVFITRVGNLSDVGLYNMGYNLVFTYAGVVFAALEADYFPRLTGVNTDVSMMNATANRQIKVCVLVMSPFLILFMVAMPLVVKMLYSSAFLPMTSMAIFASLHLFFKSMTLPVAYMSLAKGDAVIYFLMELAYDTFTVTAVAVGYWLMDITGTGVALWLAGVFDWCLIYRVYGKKYGFRPDKASYSFIFCQFVCVLAALVMGLQANILLRMASGIILLCASIAISYKVIRNEITLFKDLKRILWNKVIKPQK